MVVVGEAVDGFQCVKYAQELQPDLILLDIGLPKLNGIEAARRICKVSPQSKIVFVTGETDQEIRQAAMSVGACGFVLKADVFSGLTPAIEAILARGKFIAAMSRPPITR